MEAKGNTSLCNTVEWARLRRNYLDRLIDDIRRGLVDSDIVDLLDALNSVECIVTTSSCSGRIAVFAAPSPGNKRLGGIVHSWHRRINVDEFYTAIRTALDTSYRFVWASAQPVILALYTCSEAVAKLVVDVAVSAGFKYAFYRRASSGKYYVLILGVERIDIPLSIGGKQIIPLSKEKLHDVVDVLNTYLTLAKSKLRRLKRAVATSITVLKGSCEEATLHRAQICNDDH
ncbi:tRNA(Phe) 7-((3-amino-3-carboxypropyl)-4-demethylwyosine(37)-N(4))-methyltransferase [Hyperthermus butylicus]|uniref:tRNA(Phe) 7-((3-amino-3-carboxypropyl)-4-demethylwyosine(37)-N(4))- methyltransferase n=1 Tax=Hyperthermus butylicus TaxID=54248 RepID=UPI00064FE6BE|nr:tRNA wybutosine-synthesizing 3 family protein [Hyperthermus butylicus]